MADQALDFCIANRLAAAMVTNEDGSPLWRVSNQRSVGLVEPGRICGEGETLEAALKEYMSVALDQRASTKEPLVAYTADAIADAEVAAAFEKDEAIIKPLPRPVEPSDQPVVPDG